MKNLRKLLAVVVVVAVMLTYAIPAFAATPSDVVGTDYEDAVAKLVALGIVTGRPDGTYAPNDTISRAEFAAIVVRALGYENAAAAAKAQTKFSDVASTHWAAGYINLAVGLGIIKGRPDGSFGPDDKVLYEEAVTMVVRALGYEPAAAAKGGYPAGYLVVANEEGVTEDAVAAAGTQASRGLVALLVNNSLEVPMMIQVGYGAETKFVKSGEEGTDEQTVIGTKLGLDKATGTVTSVDDDEIEVNGDEYTLFEGLSSVGLEDAVITFWYDGDVIYSYSIDSTVYYDFISEINGEDTMAEVEADDADVETEEVTEYTLLNADETIDTAEDDDGDISYTVSYNGTDITGDDVDNLMGAFAKIVVNDDAIVSIEAYGLIERGIITAVEDEYIEYTIGATEERKLRGMDDADTLLVVIDGEVATYDDLEEDMLFDAVEYTADDWAIVASTVKAEGKLSNVDVEGDAVVKVGGTEYDLDANSYFSTDDGDGYAAIADDESLDDLIGVDVTAYIDAEGNLRYVKASVDEETSTFYGYVQKAWQTDTDYIKVFRNVDGEGESVNYALDLDDDSDNDYAAVDAVEGTVAAVFKFTINSDGDITRIDDITFTPIAAGVIDSFDEDNDAIVDDDTDPDTKYYVEDAEMFDLEDPDDPALILWEDIKNEEPDATLAVRMDTGNNLAKCVVFTAGVGAISADEEFVAFVVDRDKYDADNYELTLLDATGEFTKLIDESERPAINDFIVYVKDGEDAIEREAVYNWEDNLVDIANTWEVDDAVYAIDGSFVQFDDGGAWFKVASDAVVVEIVEDGVDVVDTAEEASFNDIVEGDKVKCYLDEGIIKAIFFKQN